VLESYKLKLRDREEEIQILNNHINDITHSHSFAVEKLQSVSKELEKERLSSKRISQPINMSHFAPCINEDDFEKGNTSVAYSERGNFMDESEIHGDKEQTHHHNESKFTLQDELGALNMDENDFGDVEDEMLFSRNTSYELHQNDDWEMGRLFNNSPFGYIEEKKHPPRSPPGKHSPQNEGYKIGKSYYSEKDVMIEDLRKQLELEKEIKENYQKKSVDYMFDYIKAEKRRKEIEIYLGIKRKAKKRNVAYAVGGIVFIIFLIFLFSSLSGK
jgi:hypothetical protein